MASRDDDRRIAELKAKLGVRTKVEVLQMALALLEQEIARQSKMKQWEQATALAAGGSREMNHAFRRHS